MQRLRIILEIHTELLLRVRDKEENLAKAIRAYEEALKIKTLEKYPIDYAMTQNNLGNAYGTFSEVRDREENLTKAVRAYEEALKIRTIEKYPLDYARTQNNLGMHTSVLPKFGIGKRT